MKEYDLHSRNSILLDSREIVTIGIPDDKAEPVSVRSLTFNSTGGLHGLEMSQYSRRERMMEARLNGSFDNAPASRSTRPLNQACPAEYCC